MGLIRKSLSLTTLGAVDMRSDKERTAAYTKGARREAQKQTKIMQQQARAQAQFQQAQLAAQQQAQQPADVQPMPEQPVLPPSAERETLLARLAELDSGSGPEPAPSPGGLEARELEARKIKRPALLADRMAAIDAEPGPDFIKNVERLAAMSDVRRETKAYKLAVKDALNPEAPALRAAAAAEKARVATLPFRERVAESTEARTRRQGEQATLHREQKVQEAAEKTARYAETESRDRAELSRLEQLQSDPDASLRENLAEISSKGRQQRAEDRAKRVAGKEAKAAGRQEKKAARKADKATPHAAAQVFPEGWYADGQDETIVRWYDGTKWTGATRPREQ